MSNASTKRMIRAYIERSPVSLFLSGMFLSPPMNFHNTEKVEIDIERGDEDVAIVISDLSTGYRVNSTDIFTNKEFIPPIFKESAPLNAFDLIKRSVGNNPFADVSFQAEAITRSFNSFRKIEAKIRRSIELQASQVLQSGVVTLTDSGGVALYSLDYSPKATHFPTSAIAWGAPGATPLEDVSALAEIIRDDGKENPNTLIMGIDAYEAFISDDAVKSRLDTRRIDVGMIAPEAPRGDGGTFRGIVDIGTYRYDIWTYGGKYKHPQTGVVTSFMDPDKVIVRSATGRLDATFGAIPSFVQPDQRALPFLPSRISNVAGGIDMFTNAWLTPDGEQLFVGVGSRPLMIPTAIDTYGCLDTTP